jgi:hypothetical protein
MTGILNVLAGDNAPASGSSYTGPGDIVASALVWYGLRGYSAAYSTGSNPCIDIVDTSSANQATINILSDGTLDVATLTTWIGNHGTAWIKKLYDQSGNANHVAPASANGGIIIATGVLTPPVISLGGTSAMNSTSNVVQSEPYSLSYVADRLISGRGGYNSLIGSGVGTMQTGSSLTNDKAFLFIGSPVEATATDGAFHAIQDTYNSTTSEIYVDGSGTTVNIGGTTGLSNKFEIGAGGGTNNFKGYFTEVGAWAGAFSSGNKSSLNSNQHTYWGF